MIHLNQRLTQLFIAMLAVVLLVACGGMAAPQTAEYANEAPREEYTVE